MDMKKNSSPLPILLLGLIVFFGSFYLHFKDVSPSFELPKKETLHLLKGNECATIQPNKIFLNACTQLAYAEIAFESLSTEGLKKGCVKSKFVLNRPQKIANQSYFTGIYIKSSDQLGFNKVMFGIDELGNLEVQLYLNEELVHKQVKEGQLGQVLDIIVEMTSAKHYSYFGRHSFLFGIGEEDLLFGFDESLKFDYREFGAFTGDKMIGFFLKNGKDQNELTTTINDLIIYKDWASQD